MAATALLAAVSGRLAAQSPEGPAPRAIRVTPENVRLNNYLHDLTGPTLIKVVGGSLLDQVGRDDKFYRFGDQLASRAGQAAVQVSVRHGLAAVMHHSTDYEPCGCRGLGPKVEHALLETFTDRRPDGSRALSVPAIAGGYAGSFARMAWDRDMDASDAAFGATVSLGFSALFNIARELTGIGR